MEQYVTSILIALIGIIPAVLAYRSAHRAKKSVELAGSDVTVQNWNKLIKNLYGEIERLTDQNDAERARAQKRERELTEANDALRQELEDMQQQAD